MRHQRWSEIVAVFLKLGAMSYGGPAILTLATVVAIVAWRLSPLPAMAAGGVIGAVLKAR